LSDEREYRAVMLRNELRVLLVRDADCMKPAAAMAVGVGAGRDPPQLPGLAHFTEHMSMQGSDQFPEDNAYKQYLNKHGGSCNATTSMEHTWYRFTVAEEPGGAPVGVVADGAAQEAEATAAAKGAGDPGGSSGGGGAVLGGALDMFARFFAAPLFKAECVAREVLAIDAEDAKNRTSDDRRLLQV